MSSRPMPSSFDDDPETQETGGQKVWRKLKEEPLIPLGTALTCAALYNAWRAMRRGDHNQVQRMFRARIGAQAFTVCAIVAGGAYYGQDRAKRAELIKLEAQKRAEERHQKWLRELEIRDEEEKQLKEHLRRREERKKARAASQQEEEKKAEGKTSAGKGAEVLKVETTQDAEGQVASDGKDAGGGVLGALSSLGGWFGTSKQQDAKEKKIEEAAKK